MNSGPHRALTLLETVMASFLLLCGLLVVVNLFHSAFGFTTRSENHQLAAFVAERHLERLRSWAETPQGGRTRYDDPGLAATYNGQTQTVSDFSQFEVDTNVTLQPLYSPCSQFESQIGVVAPFVTRRVLPASASKVQVTVRWREGGPRSLTLVTLFSRPALEWASAGCVTVVGSPANPLPQGANATFTAQGLDSSGAPITDVFFRWQIAPGNGTGTLLQARDGSLAQITNRIYGPPYLAGQSPPYQGIPANTGGQCRVQAIARYHGRAVSTNSTVVQLQ